MGMLYKRGEVFWTNTIALEADSGKYHTRKQKEAEWFLKDREGRVAMGTPILPKVERTTVGDL